MMRTETYCGGRLVKRVGMVNVASADTGFHDHWVDGRHEWLLDGELLESEEEALRLIASGPTAIRLLEEALHLRMHGERAPGGNETWREWDRKTETFLRSLYAESPHIARTE